MHNEAVHELAPQRGALVGHCSLARHAAGLLVRINIKRQLRGQLAQQLQRRLQQRGQVLGLVPPALKLAAALRGAGYQRSSSAPVPRQHAEALQHRVDEGLRSTTGYDR